MTNDATESRSRPEQGPVATAQASPLDAVRAFGVMLGPSLLLDLFMGGSVVATAMGQLAQPPRTRAAGLLRPLVALGDAALALYLFVVRPWMLRWGATDEDLRKPLPGDDLVPDPLTTSTRVITVNAPLEALWPWLAQIGQDRGGMYSYEWLENLAGCQMRNADRIHPEWQHRAIGEVVKLHPALGMPVVAFEPNRAIVLQGWGAFVVEPLDAQRTRVLLRSRTPRGWGVLYSLLFIELPHFLMERKMLLGLKERAERAWASRDGAETAPVGDRATFASP